MPAPTGMHAKALRELSEQRAHLVIRPRYCGTPNHVMIYSVDTPALRGALRWSGHRDALPAAYRGAQDPYRCMTCPPSD